MKDLIIDLYNKNCIKFGKFTLKNGTTSPIYIDMKNIISYPYLVNIISNFFINEIKSLETNYICGVPYGGIPIASLISNKNNIPMLMIRKEIKKYGLKKSIEGEYEKGQTCILIEDTITTGSSINKFVNLLIKEGIIVKHVFVICDRRDKNTIPSLRYKIQSLFDIVFIFKTLKKHGFIKFNEQNMNYLKGFIFKKYGNFIDFESKKKSIKSLDKTCSALISIILKKQTNLCFSVPLQEEIEIELLVKTIGKIGKHICILKINSDNIKGITENPGYKTALLKMSNEMEFMIYDDKKISTLNNFEIPWCNFYSVLGFTSLDPLFQIEIQKQKIQGIHDYKGLVLTDINKFEELNTQNIVIYEGKEIINKKDKKDLFLSDSFDLDIISFDTLTNIFEEYLIEYDFDLISVSKNLNDGDSLESSIILTKNIAWSAYNDKIH
jgi:orotate phosphoribosyltransferase